MKAVFLSLVTLVQIAGIGAFSVQKPLTAFVSSSSIPSFSAQTHCHRNNPQLLVLLRGSSSDDDTSTSSSSSSSGKRRNKRVLKRKDEVAINTSSTATSSDKEVEVQLKPRKESSVSLQVQDVREAVGGKAAPAPTAAQSANKAEKRVRSTAGSSTSGSSSSVSDSLAQLLQDAKMMAKDEKESSLDESEEESFSLKTAIGNVISTIVTADFFVVLVLLAWFLIGIFASSILKDDAIQISFNNNFSTFTQPALGLLMVGSIASAFFKDPEDF
jgi:hypothetical protein